MRNASTKKEIAIIATTILLAIVAWFIFFSSSVTTSAVPFGLPAGTKINIGEKAKFPKTPAFLEHDLQRADDLRIAGALDAAQSVYETILLKSPDLPAALFGATYSLLASDNVSNEKFARAKIHIENLSKQMPNSVWVRLLLTFVAEAEGSLNSALNMAAELAKASPAFGEARLRHADLLLLAGQAAKAIEEARAAISISKGSDARAFVSLASALHKIGNLKECSDLVNYAMPRFPSQTKLMLLHGYLNEYSHNFDIAQNEYRKVLLLEPENAAALNAMATLGEKAPPSADASSQAGGLSLRDMARESAKIMLPLIQEYPENLPLREALGRIYLKARLMREARAQFSEIYAQDFEYPNIRRLLNEASEEASIAAPRRLPPKNDKNLADSLAKTFAALKA
ncbi:MAG: hypothetical protein LBC85_01675, partial [Fibromonadaceae bacterium]|nr:hypothetical protein [Fibromonadaceae bacterium]